MISIYILRMEGLTEFCTACKRLHPGKRVEVCGQLRFISLNRDKSIHGTNFRSSARLDMKNFNVISCIIHTG